MTLDDLMKHNFFTKKISKSGNQAIISIPTHLLDIFKVGDEVIVIKKDGGKK